MAAAICLVAPVSAYAQAVIPGVGVGPLVPGAEAASTAEEDLPVMGRPRPEFDPIGIPVSSFLLFPQFTVDGSYDTNVLRTPTNDQSDYFFTIAPSFRMTSQW